MNKMRSMLTIIVLIVIASLVTGCGLFKPKQVTVMPAYGEMVSIPKAAPTNLRPLEFKISKSQVASSENPNTLETIVLYSLDEMNMQVLTANIDDLQRYIREQQQVVNYLTGLINLRKEEKEPAK